MCIFFFATRACIEFFSHFSHFGYKWRQDAKKSGEKVGKTFGRNSHFSHFQSIGQSNGKSSGSKGSGVLLSTGTPTK